MRRTTRMRHVEVLPKRHMLGPEGDPVTIEDFEQIMHSWTDSFVVQHHNDTQTIEEWMELFVDALPWERRH